MASTSDCGVGTHTTSLPACPTSGVYSLVSAAALSVVGSAQAVPAIVVATNAARTALRMAIINKSPLCSFLNFGPGKVLALGVTALMIHDPGYGLGAAAGTTRRYHRLRWSCETTTAASRQSIPPAPAARPRRYIRCWNTAYTCTSGKK